MNLLAWKLESEAKTGADRDSVLWLNGGVNVAGIGEDTDVVRDTIFQTTASVTEAMAGAIAVSRTTANEGVRSEVDRADRETNEEVASGGPLCSVVVTTEEVLLDTDTDEFREEVVNPKSTTPTWLTLIEEGSQTESVNLNLLIPEFAFRSGGDSFFERFG